ncbi:hypothetical protein ABVK25_009213 [Lepraria finkii]|uniref:Ribosomal protein S14 n=1 Tax=Lepraria finkii TaxID=1340010 RepID=A0ABR4AY91_9LECA
MELHKSLTVKEFWAQKPAESPYIQRFLEHKLVRLSTDPKPCRACTAVGRNVGRQIGKAASKRNVLGELSTNSVLQGSLAGRHKERPPRSRPGCNIPISTYVTVRHVGRTI